MYNDMNNYRNAHRNDAASWPREFPVLLESKHYGKSDGTASFLSGFNGLMPVRVLKEKDLALFVADTPKFEVEYGAIPTREREYLWSLLRLAGAVKARNQGEISEAFGQITAHMESPRREITLWELGKGARQFVSREISQGASKAQLVLWYRPRGYVIPGLFCPTLLSAVYTLALVTIAGGKGLGACQICGKPLVRKRGTRLTCAGKCRQKKYRLKHSGVRRSDKKSRIPNRRKRP